MIEIPLQAIPNQNFSITLDGVAWYLSIKKINNGLATLIAKNETVVMQGIVPGALTNLMPYPFQYFDSGNFFFWTADYEYPDYKKFGITHFLFYLSHDEIVSLYPTNNYYSVSSIIPNTQTVYFLLQNGDKFTLQDGASFLLQDSKDI